MRQVYGHTCNDHDHNEPTFFDIAASSELDDMIARMIAQVYDQKLQAGDVDADVWKHTTEQYWKAIQEGYGDTPFYSKLQMAMLELRRNVNTFSAFKNHSNVFEMTLLLTDENGQPRTFSEFKKLALRVNEKYNVNWLEAEYNLALRSAQASAQWQRFVEKGGKLEYKTIGDGRVRDEHARLAGTILPVSHAFWSTYYPPNGWNCRCFVRWRPDDTVDVPPTALPDVNEMFRNNVGMTGAIFTNDHPFIKEIGAAQAEKIRNMAEQSTLRWERGYLTKTLKDNLLSKTTPVEILGTPTKVKYSSKRLGKAVSQPHENQMEKNRALLNIQQLIKDAVYVKTAPNSSAWKTQVKQYHYYLTEISERPSYIILEEMNDGTIYFYSIVDSLKV